MERPENRRAQSGRRPCLTWRLIPVHRSDGSGTTFHFHRLFEQRESGLGGHRRQGHFREMARWHRPRRQRQRRRGRPGQANFRRHRLWRTRLRRPEQNSLRRHEKFVGQFHFARARLPSAPRWPPRPIPDDFRFSMVNAPGDEAYPIAGASWVLVYQQQKDPDRGKNLVAFLKWAVTDGQKLSSDAGLRAAARQRPAARVEVDRHN